MAKRNDILTSIHGRQIGLNSDDELVVSGQVIGGATIAVPSSRTLTKEDNGGTLDCTTSGVDLTLRAGLNNFGCAIIKNGTTRVVGAAGVTVNGILAGTVTLTADVGAIVPTSVANNYRVVGV